MDHPLLTPSILGHSSIYLVSLLLAASRAWSLPDGLGVTNRSQSTAVFRDLPQLGHNVAM
jgi:hypothetical protein